MRKFIIKHKKRIIEVGVGRISYQAFNTLFDDVAWPAMIIWLGWKGGLIMSGISLVQCALTLMWYQRKGRDWLGIGLMEAARENGYEIIKKFFTIKTKSFKDIPLDLVKIVSVVPVLFIWIALWLMKKNKTLAFFGLGMIQDPFEVTAYFKHADFSNKNLTKRDWMIFLASWLWTNIYWNGRSWLTAIAIVWGLSFFK